MKVHGVRACWQASTALHCTKSLPRGTRPKPARPPACRADEDGGTPLHLASHWGRAEAVQLLLQAGAYAGAAEAASGNTALHRVVRGWQRGRAAQYTATAAALLELGRADPCQPNAAGDTPLSLAAAAENESLVDLFQQSVERAQAGLLAFPGEPVQRDAGLPG